MTEVMTTGWVGFGLATRAPTGMIGYDLAVGGVAAGVGYLRVMLFFSNVLVVSLLIVVATAQIKINITFPFLPPPFALCYFYY